MIVILSKDHIILPEQIVHDEHVIVVLGMDHHLRLTERRDVRIGSVLDRGI
jgi:hypothetical protein